MGLQLISILYTLTSVRSARNETRKSFLDLSFCSGGTDTARVPLCTANQQLNQSMAMRFTERHSVERFVLVDMFHDFHVPFSF